jgi:3-hydroxyisobutyrate dehydrogenase-like beta-hydroxyacid dehydrogenase
MKVLNNALSNSNGELAIMAIRIGIILGLDPVCAVEILRSGGAQSFSLHNLVTRLVPDPGYVTHARDMITKDLRLFTEAREQAGLEPTLLEELAGLRAGDPAPRFLADSIGHTLGAPYSQTPTPAV